MPMNFPDLSSLQNAARNWSFRDPHENESEAMYRRALADHVQPKDYIEAHEIRTSKGWDQWTQRDQQDMLSRVLGTR